MHSTIKKRSTIVLSILLLFSVLPLSRQASAAESVESSSVFIEDLGNGYTVETTTTVMQIRFVSLKRALTPKAFINMTEKKLPLLSCMLLFHIMVLHRVLKAQAIQKPQPLDGYTGIIILLHLEAVQP